MYIALDIILKYYLNSNDFHNAFKNWYKFGIISSTKLFSIQARFSVVSFKILILFEEFYQRYKNN